MTTTHLSWLEYWLCWLTGLYRQMVNLSKVILASVASWVKDFACSIARSFLGQDMLIHIDDLKHYVARSPTFYKNQDKAEVRLLTVFVSIAFLLLSIEPIFYIFQVPDSLLAKVSNIAWSKSALITAYTISSLSTLPHLYTLLFRPDLQIMRQFRCWATVGAIISAVAWLMLANLVIPLDHGPLEWAYGIRGLICICVAIIFALSVNAQQMREILSK